VSSTEPVTSQAPAVPADTFDSAEWLRANWITVAAVVGLVLELWWRAGMLADSYFQQNDFSLLYRAAASKLGPGYLLTPSDGQVAPAGRAVIWLEARAGIYNWGLASAITLIMLGLAALALLRLLRTLFGDKPGILVPYALCLATPLVVPGLTWWSAAISWLPLQIATFMAVSAHVRYIRTSRFRHAVAAACWMAAGVLFMGKGVLTPLLLLALTSAFLIPGLWGASLLKALRQYWRGWLAYAVVIAAYLALDLSQVIGSGFAPRLMTTGPALSFASALVRIGLVPAMFGGPWRWLSTGSSAAAAHLAVLTGLSWLGAVAAVGASVWFRRRAWRAWAILVAWLVIADIVPVVLGWYGAVLIPDELPDRRCCRARDLRDAGVLPGRGRGEPVPGTAAIRIGPDHGRCQCGRVGRPELAVVRACL
jgi:hypothetical protein